MPLAIALPLQVEEVLIALRVAVQLRKERQLYILRIGSQKRFLI